MSEDLVGTVAPTAPSRVFPGFTFRSMSDIVRDTDILNKAIRRADENRSTMRPPTTRRYTEEPYRQSNY